MRIPLEIAFNNMESSAAMESLIRDRVERLVRFDRSIIACRVAVEAPHRSGNADAVGYRVRIEVSVPGTELVVSRDRSHKRAKYDPYTAIREAFSAADRQVKSHSGRQRQHRHPQAGPPHALVVRLFPDEDYGFLRAHDGRQIYFHRNSVVNEQFDQLELGDEVRFEATRGREGPQATTVDRIGRHGHRYLS